MPTTISRPTAMASLCVSAWTSRPVSRICAPRACSRRCSRWAIPLCAMRAGWTRGASSRLGYGPLDAAFSLAEMEALVTESHALGWWVMCYALGGFGLRIALAVGVDSIEHGCYLDEDAILLGQMAV